MHPIKPEITIDVLQQVDIRVGTIERVEDVAGSDKLVRLIVNFGDHTRRAGAIRADQQGPAGRDQCCAFSDQLLLDASIEFFTELSFREDTDRRR